MINCITQSIWHNFSLLSICIWGICHAIWPYNSCPKSYKIARYVFPVSRSNCIFRLLSNRSTNNCNRSTNCNSTSRGSSNSTPSKGNSYTPSQGNSYTPSQGNSCTTLRNSNSTIHRLVVFHSPSHNLFLWDIFFFVVQGIWNESK